MPVIKSGCLEAGWIVPAIASAIYTVGVNPYQLFNGALIIQWVWNCYDLCIPLQQDSTISTIMIV